MKNLAFLFVLLLSFMAFAQGGRAPATDCDDQLQLELARLFEEDQGQLIELQARLTLLKLARHLAPGTTTLESAIAQSQNQLAQASAADQQAVLPRLRQLYRLDSEAPAEAKLLARAQVSLSGANYARAALRLQNEGASSYMLQHQLAHADSPFDTMDVAVAWAMQRLTAAQEYVGNSRGSSEHNLTLLSVRLAQFMNTNPSPSAVEAQLNEASAQLDAHVAGLIEELRPRLTQCASVLPDVASLKRLISQFLNFTAPTTAQCPGPVGTGEELAEAVELSNSELLAATAGEAPAFARDNLVDNDASVEVRSCRAMSSANGLLPVIGRSVPQQCAFQSVGFGPMPAVEGYSFYTRDQQSTPPGVNSLPGRSWNIDFMDRARQQMSFTVQDFNPANARYSDNYSSTFFVFPRRQVPEMIPNLSGVGYTLVLATGERVVYGAGGVIQGNSPLREGELSAARRHPAVSYTGSGVSVRFNQDGPYRHPTDGNGVVEIRKGNRTCARPVRKSELMVGAEWRAFRFPTDAEFDAFLQRRCGFGIN